MHTLLVPTIILILFVLVRSADLAISYGVARDVIRAVCYGIIAILALIALLLAVV